MNMTKKEMAERIKELEAGKSADIKKTFDNFCWLIKTESKKTGKIYYRLTRFVDGKPVPVKDPSDPAYDLVAFPAGDKGHIAINRFYNVS